MHPHLMCQIIPVIETCNLQAPLSRKMKRTTTCKLKKKLQKIKCYAAQIKFPVFMSPREGDWSRGDWMLST
jgi:hypothetical protein